ncbi:HPr kinase/phosphorylase [Sulfitobacter sp. S190]|uniref:HPr kinase/phosphorylase n=1 Tax=Sulfitobacter sp. S190 TaxID=2867022 RepID=UPI0021A958C8|nr:HPr kinase/phosphatase C-terminal domain-containing protein [Sulfitobacter sp. S190]UWR22919.1 HPr kinase/phosphatase C-terminal domain-containing protein [Sulfitobacter sp. S190]
MTPTVLHASCVAVNGRAALLLGPSGSGKSALALQMIALGGVLVADDRTELVVKDRSLHASAVGSIAGLIEARGVGILAVEHVASAPVRFVVDLAQTERDRLPHWRTTDILDISLPTLHNCASPHFAAALVLYLKGHRKHPP